ncbi:hypothetical protein [Nonomuraea dietziae]|uniref:hypothetical protein n=1 Tax=Nonomuraea dietziae TaxID=65515 RepID=UPI0031D610DA
MITTYGPVTALTVSGLGEPGGGEHTSAITALYTVAAAMNVPFGPLEGRWWVEDERPALQVPREQWRWHLHLPLPAVPADGQMERAREAARPSGAAVDRVQVVTFTEGECVRSAARGPPQRRAPHAGGDAGLHGRPRSGGQRPAPRGVPVGPGRERPRHDAHRAAPARQERGDRPVIDP